MASSFVDQLAQLHPVLQGFLGTLFTWFTTACGASLVFFTDVSTWCAPCRQKTASTSAIAATTHEAEDNQTPSSTTAVLASETDDASVPSSAAKISIDNGGKQHHYNHHHKGHGGHHQHQHLNPNHDTSSSLEILYGFGGGVMLAASYFSLLAPSVEFAAQNYSRYLAWMPPFVGFSLGVGLLMFCDWLLEKIMNNPPSKDLFFAKQIKHLLSRRRSKKKRGRRNSSNGNNNSIQLDSTTHITDMELGVTPAAAFTEPQPSACPNNDNCSNSSTVLTVLYDREDLHHNHQRNHHGSTSSSSSNGNDASYDDADTHLLTVSRQVQTTPSLLINRPSSPSPPHDDDDDDDHDDEVAQTHTAEATAAKAAAQRRRTLLLILAITIHNFPEGLVIGVAFGAAAASAAAGVSVGAETFSGALGLALGIGIQNIPEGIAVSMPLRREGFSRIRSFFWGQMSGVVEIMGGLIGSALVVVVAQILPYALAFAAGAMIFVVVCQLVPEIAVSKHRGASLLGVMIGFALMMVLDIALG